MKQILLLAAIYSLVLHQSRKISAARVIPVSFGIEIQKASLATGLYAYIASQANSDQDHFRFAKSMPLNGTSYKE